MKSSVRVMIMMLIGVFTISVYAGDDTLEDSINSNGNKDKFSVVVFYDNSRSVKYMSMLKSAEIFVKNNPDAMLTNADIKSEYARSVVEKYRLSRAPLPLVLIFAPNGAVTAGYAGEVDLTKLKKAIVGPVEQEIVKARQENRPVFIKVPGKTEKENRQLDDVIRDFEREHTIAPKVIEVTGATRGREELSSKYGIDFSKDQVQLIILSTSGAVAGSFAGGVTVEEILKSLQNANSSCCG